jgi:hypothetical protein
MKIEARTEHYWVDTVTGNRFDTRLYAEVYALHREICIELGITHPTQMSLMKDVARYICGNYELQSLRDEDNPKNWETRPDEGHAG